MAMFSRFTERGQRALVAAQKEAAQLGRNYVGTEHLLLGILADPGNAAEALGGITLDSARQEVVQMLGRGDDNSPVRTMVYTPSLCAVYRPWCGQANCRRPDRASAQPPAARNPA